MVRGFIREAIPGGDLGQTARLPNVHPQPIDSPRNVQGSEAIWKSSINSIPAILLFSLWSWRLFFFVDKRCAVSSHGARSRIVEHTQQFLACC